MPRPRCRPLPPRSAAPRRRSTIISPPRKNLFLAVIDEKCRDVHATIADIIADVSDFRTLTDLTDTVVRMILDDQSIAIRRLITAEAARFSELGRGFYTCGRQKGIANPDRIFRARQKAGKLKLASPRTMVTLIWACARANCRCRNSGTSIRRRPKRKSGHHRPDRIGVPCRLWRMTRLCRTSESKRAIGAPASNKQPKGGILGTDLTNGQTADRF